MSQVRRRLLGLISSVKARGALYKQACFKYNSYQIECFSKQSICIDKFPFENNFKRTKILFSNGLIWMSLVCRELTGIILALEQTLRNNRRVLMRTSNSLLRNYRYIATVVLALIKANGNFNNASLERLHSVSGLGINGVLSPSDAFDLGSLLNWMFQNTAFCVREQRVTSLAQSWLYVDRMFSLLCSKAVQWQVIACVQMRN